MPGCQVIRAHQAQNLNRDANLRAQDDVVFADSPERRRNHETGRRVRTQKCYLVVQAVMGADLPKTGFGR